MDLVIEKKSAEEIIEQKQKVVSQEGKKGEDKEEILEAKKIIADLEARPILEIFIAFEPSDNFVKAIKQTLISVNTPACLLSLKTRRSIVAGAIINWKGKQHDYSWSKKLDNLKEYELV